MQYQDLGLGITRIDTGLGRPGMAACYLMAHEGRLAVIETGTAHTVPSILALIDERGYQRSAVDYVIVTHVHLDHAGGVGELMRQLPSAQLVVHPRGARHMVDPSQLQAGAMAVYGEASYRQQYGELLPVAQERVISAEDGSCLQLGDRQLHFYDTPGHAKHHFCVHDPFSAGIFTGDTMGIVYRELCEGFEPFVVVTTTPVQFDPAAMKQSIDRLMALQPERLFLTHFGMVPASAAHAESLKQQVDDYVQIALQHRDGKGEAASLAETLMEYTLARLQAHGSPLEQSEQKPLLAMDMGLNAQGLLVWLQKQPV